MLPRWRDRASMLLAPQGVTVRLVPRGLRPAARVILHPGASGQDGEPWRGSLEAMRETMRGLRKGTACRVIVSNAFVRYALVPFSTSLVNRAANEALASHVFQHIYGERTQAWACRVAPAPSGDRRVACALDAALAAAIESTARECGIALVAVEPAFTAGFNRARRRLPYSCWFAAVETGRIVLGLLFEGKWCQLASERCAGGWKGTLARMLSREALMATLGSPVDQLPCWIARFEAPDNAYREYPEVAAFAAFGAVEQPTAGAAATTGLARA